jgi:hypothetical protein
LSHAPNRIDVLRRSTAPRAVLHLVAALRVTRLARVDDAGGVGMRNVFLELRHRCAASNKEQFF